MKKDKWIAERVEEGDPDKGATNKAATSSEGGKEDVNTTENVKPVGPASTKPSDFEQPRMERDEQMADAEVIQSENLGERPRESVGEDPTTLRSTADDAEMEHQEGLEEQGQERSERRLRTPERPPPVKRNHEEENDMMGDESKHRRIQDDADMSAVGTMGRSHGMRMTGRCQKKTEISSHLQSLELTSQRYIRR